MSRSSRHAAVTVAGEAHSVGGRERARARVLVVTMWAEPGGLRRVVTMSTFHGTGEEEPRPPGRQPAASDEAVLDLVRDWLSSVRENARPELRVVDDAGGSGVARQVGTAGGRRPRRRRR